MGDSVKFYDAEEYFDNLSDCSDDYEDVQELSLSDASTNDDTLLHSLAFYGYAVQLEEELQKCAAEEKIRQDAQGNTILHLGVLRDHKRVVEVALESGIPSDIRNARGWSALDEAIAVKNKELVCLLYLHAVQEVKKEMKAAKVHLMQTLSEMPDYSMEVDPPFAKPPPLERSVVALLAVGESSDWGSKIRVDGTLLGVDRASTSLIPEWKRGDFSLLFDGTITPALVYLVLHEKKEYLDLTEEKQERKKNGKFDFDVDMIISNGAGKTKLRATEFRFKPVKGWLSAQQTEKIENWNTKVYEASEYLKLSASEDKVIEMPVNPPGLKGQGPNEDASAEPVVDKKVKPKKLTGRCWMAEDFPMSLRQLLPLLDVVGHANKHLGRVSKFMRKYGDMHMFPVRIQVPLLLTVYLLVSFKKFKLTTCPEGWCDLPEGYKRVRLNELMPTALTGAKGGETSDADPIDYDPIDY